MNSKANTGEGISKWDKLAIGISLVILAIGITTITAYASYSAIPQFPNFFWGEATVNGEAVQPGDVVTAVVDHGLPTERHYALTVTEEGKYGGPRYNQYKLKVGGDLQGDISHLSPLKFYVTSPMTGAASLEFNTLLDPAGVGVFYGDYAVHMTVLDLDQ